MKIIQFIIFLALLLLYWLPGSANAGEKTCILDYERKIDSFTSMIDTVFAHDSSARVIHSAIPEDFLDCINDGSTEIVLIAHALESSSPHNPKSTLGLGYFKEETPGNYVIKDFLPKVFEVVRDKMREDRSLGRPAQLKQIRLMSCLPNQVLLAYPALTELISQNKITLDIAPEQVISSFLQDQQVTTLDQVWLAESAQSEEEKKSRPEWFYSYIDLNTIAVYRFGEGTALQGQYQVHVNGIALGIGSKWSMVFIRYDSLSGMAVGETRQIIYPEIDISAALWLNLQIDLLPVLTVQLPSEINSWGLSIGLASDIAVTKMY